MIKRGTSKASGSGPWPGPGAAPLLVMLLWLAMSPAPPAAAHGVELTVKQGPAAFVTAQYSGGEAMSFAKVRIIRPTGGTFQVGNADAQGRFAWLPDVAGKWRVEVEDGMGHRAEFSMELGASGAPVPQTASSSGGLLKQPLWARVVWGLTFLWGAFGLLSWVKGRRK